MAGFVDPTPKTDAEFASKTSATQLKGDLGAPRWGRMDLLTVVNATSSVTSWDSPISQPPNSQALMAGSITNRALVGCPPAMTPAMVTPDEKAGARFGRFQVGKSFDSNSAKTCLPPRRMRLFCGTHLAEPAWFVLIVPFGRRCLTASRVISRRRRRICCREAP